MNSCQKHIEAILDIFMDELEEMPLMEQVDEANLQCQICGEKALYRLAVTGVKARWD